MGHLLRMDAPNNTNTPVKRKPRGKRPKGPIEVKILPAVTLTFN